MGKFRRELTRAMHHVADALTAPRDALRRASHDRRFDPARAAVPGERPASPRIAVLVTYQPAGLPPAVMFTLRHLDEAGYAVVLVANAPLRQVDLSAARIWCWRILERPNVGYDFGGYRDAIRLLRAALAACESLLLVNDSIWLPILPQSDMLAALEADPAPFSGVALEKRAGRSARRWHYQSFLLRFHAPALQSAAFRDFWSSMRLSDTRRVVLKHGEKGLSQAMFKAGLGGQGEPTRALLLAALEGQDNAFLHQTLRYAAYDSAADLATARALIARDPIAGEWRADALGHIRHMLSWRPFVGVFGFAAIRLLGVAYMKKTSNMAVYAGMRWQYLRAVEAGDLPPPPPEILAEIRASRMSPRLTTDPQDAATKHP